MTDENDDREQGIEFGEFDDALGSVDFPIDNADLVERFGDYTLGTAEGEVTVRETLGPLSDRTYGSVEDVHDAVLNMVDDQAVGRENYTDREPMMADETSDDGDMESF